MKKIKKQNLKGREFTKTGAAAGAPSNIPSLSSTQSVDSYYDKLADALDKLPNAFPRTKSNIEIRLLKKIFTPEQAKLASQLTIETENVAVIANRVGLELKETRKKLIEMLRGGMVWGDPKKGEFRLAPFVVGIYESQLYNIDHEFAHLFEEYMDEGGAEIMRSRPAIHRVVPAQSAVKTEWILPYDDVRKILMASKSFRVRECICRKQQDLIESRRCDFPLKVELIFYQDERHPSPIDITKEKALQILDQTEDIGLVHTVSNIADGIFYICNCCGCCCAILRGINEWGIGKSVAHANYYVVIDPEKCQGCETCKERCHVDAVRIEDDIAVVDRVKCIGCGLCVTDCPNEAARLERKPEDEMVNPPENFAAWERERLAHRGLI